MSYSVAAAIAANRFGLGARPGELAGLASDPRGALKAQLTGAAPLLVRAGLTDSASAIAAEQALRQERQRERQQQAATAEVVDIGQKIGQLNRPLYVADASARLHAAATSERSFVERLVHFWANHFAVSVDKGVVLGVAGAFEREAIRPHVLGRFATLLRAVEQHPAMLLYLDNAQSSGPNSQAAGLLARGGGGPGGPGPGGAGARGAGARGAGAGRRAPGDAAAGAQVQRPRLGLNENLAREILELHTLGVDGGYSQADVTEFARAITGWSLGGGPGPQGGSEPGRFRFRPGIHEPGARMVVSRRYAEGGLEQGQAVLEDLARAPATARHIATKLARHFVSDEPSPALVERLAKAFLASEGDLPTVYRALIDAPEAWAEPLAKYKTPADFIHAAFRAVDAPLPEGQRALGPFDLLGQRIWAPGSPAGWPDRAADWDGPSALLKRVEWADQLGQRLGAQRDAQQLAPELLGEALGDRTRTAIARADSPAQALTLLLASPEFLRR